jgi:hypothetical protein
MPFRPDRPASNRKPSLNPETVKMSVHRVRDIEESGLRDTPRNRSKRANT